jgi:hypothetical protein
MTLMRSTTQTNKRKFNQINRIDLIFIVLLLAVTAYLLIQEPFMVAMKCQLSWVLPNFW